MVMDDEPLRKVQQVNIEVAPELVKGGDEALVLRREFEVELPGDKPALARVGSFLGVDTGDIVECHAEVSDPATGCRIYARSLHKETAVIYDAWDWSMVDPPVRTRKVRVSLLCRVTGRNWTVFTKRWNPLTAYFHGLVVLEWWAGE